MRTRKRKLRGRRRGKREKKIVLCTASYEACTKIPCCEIVVLCIALISSSLHRLPLRTRSHFVIPYIRQMLVVVSRHRVYRTVYRVKFHATLVFSSPSKYKTILAYLIIITIKKARVSDITPDSTSCEFSFRRCGLISDFCEKQSDNGILEFTL